MSTAVLPWLAGGELAVAPAFGVLGAVVVAGEITMLITDVDEIGWWRDTLGNLLSVSDDDDPIVEIEDDDGMTPDDNDGVMAPNEPQTHTVAPPAVTTHEITIEIDDDGTTHIIDEDGGRDAVDIPDTAINPLEEELAEVYENWVNGGGWWNRIDPAKQSIPGRVPYLPGNMYVAIGGMGAIMQSLYGGLIWLQDCAADGFSDVNLDGNGGGSGGSDPQACVDRGDIWLGNGVPHPTMKRNRGIGGGGCTRIWAGAGGLDVLADMLDSLTTGDSFSNRYEVYAVNVVSRNRNVVSVWR